MLPRVCRQCQHSGVKNSPPDRTSYHHGDLRNALIEAAVAAARVGGPGAVVLREVARQVGVSHNAGYRHFTGRDDLLTAVAERGLAELAGAIEAGLRDPESGDPEPGAPGSGAPEPGGLGSLPDPRATARNRLRAVGRSYVTYALSEPGLFRTIWAAPLDPGDEPGPAALGPRGLGAYQLLNEALDDLVRVGVLSPARRPFSEIAAWSAVHGLATLVIDGPLGLLSPEEVDRALTRLCDIVDAGLP